MRELRIGNHARILEKTITSKANFLDKWIFTIFVVAQKSNGKFILPIQFSISIEFVYTQLNVKTELVSEFGMKISKIETSSVIV